MSTGELASLAIEFLIRSDADQTQENYERELQQEIRKLCNEFRLQSDSALSITLKQLRGLRLQEREAKALTVFRANFPELSGKHDSKVLELLGRLEGVERDAGRLEVIKAKVLRSNIHTVLKPLDHSWNTRFGLDQMQKPAEETQARASELLAERVASVEDFDGWERKVFALFEGVLVFDGTEIDLKPAGTIDPRQLRLYKRNWMNWCDVNRQRVIETMNNRDIDLESKPRTRTYNLNSQVRRLRTSNIQKSINMEIVMLERLQKQIYEETERNNSSERKSQLMEVYKQNSARLALLQRELQSERAPAYQNGLMPLPTSAADKSFKILVRRNGHEEFEGERTWRSKQDLLIEFGLWLISLQKVWDDSTTDLIISFESESPSGLTKVVFGTSSVAQAQEKIQLLTV